jgi:hypothetical protein
LLLLLLGLEGGINMVRGPGIVSSLLLLAMLLLLALLLVCCLLWGTLVARTGRAAPALDLPCCCICCIYYVWHVYICCSLCCLLLFLLHLLIWIQPLLLLVARPRPLPAAVAAASAARCWLAAGLLLTLCQLLQLLRLHQTAEQGIQPLDSQLMPPSDVVVLQDIVQQDLTQTVTRV